MVSMRVKGGFKAFLSWFGLSSPWLKPERFLVWFKEGFKRPLLGFDLNSPPTET